MSVVNPANFNTATVSSDLQVRDVSSVIGFLNRTRAQVLFLAAKPRMAVPFNNALGIPEIGGAKPLTFGVRTVMNYKYEWMEDSMHEVTTAINKSGGYTSSDTSLVVDDASIFTENDIIDLVATGEICLVTSVNISTNTLTVTRSLGATAAASIADNAVVLVIGNAYSEAGGYKNGAHKNPTLKYNYIQDLRQAFTTTQMLGLQEHYHGNQRKYMQNKMLVDHTRKIESSLLFSEISETTAGDGSPRRTIKGLLESQAGNNVTAVGGALSKSTFNTWLKDLFTYGSTNEKLIIGSPTVMNAISNFAGDDSAAPKSQMWIMNNAKEYGLNIMSYTTKFGIVHLIMHDMFSGSVYGGYALGLDPNNLQLVRIRGGDFFSFREDITKIGTHTYTDEYSSMFGLEYKNPETGGLLTGVTG